MSTFKDCRLCEHATPAYHSLLCTVENFPKPVEYMRDPRSACGFEGALFDPKPVKPEHRRD